MTKSKWLLILVTLFIACSFSACGQKSEAAGSQSDANQSSGTNAESSAANDSATTSAGSSATDAEESEAVSSQLVDMTDVMPWPANFIPGVPELAGKISNIIYENETYATVYLQNVTKADFTAYVSVLKAAGYTTDASETVDADSIYYNGTNAKGDYVEVSYVISEQKADIYMIKSDE